MVRRDDPATMAELQAFIDSLTAEVDGMPAIDDEARDRILGVTGVTAHGIVRPAGPIASLLIGYLVGTGRAASWQDAADTVRAAVRARMDEHPADDR